MPTKSATKNAKIYTAVIAGPFLLSCLFAIHFQVYLFLVFVSGLSLFIFAKSSVFQRREFTTFGPSGMNRKMKKCYYFGYLLMIVPGLVTLGLALMGTNARGF